MAITGLNLFVKHFADHKDKFVLIGGSASYINLEEQGLPFRRTQDLDIVLLLDLERTDTQFTILFWKFIKLAGYEVKQCSSGKPNLYRFSNPKDKSYPYMIELFSRKLKSLELHGASLCTPIPAEDELSSLSAILLDDNYYTLITSNCKMVSDIPVVTPECLIALKAKAFLDMTVRKSAGEKIDSDKIKKHKYDIFRLSQLLTEDDRCIVAQTIKEDLKNFIKITIKQQTDLKSLGLKNMVVDDVFEIITSVFEL